MFDVYFVGCLRGCVNGGKLPAMDLTTEMTQKLQAAFPDGDVDVRDPNKDGAHFEATVISSRFAGLGRVQQHRLVYAALGDMLQERVHALALTTQVK